MEAGNGDKAFPGYEIDGSVLEGGGQIVRNAVAVSAILQRPVRITKIRAGRKKPGLSYQHTRGIELVQNISNGRLSGCQLESQEVSFSPGMLLGGDYVGDSTTAGSVGLLFQIALPCALFANGPTILRLRGGTNADFAPPVDYVQKVLLPILTRFGINVELNIIRRGYYPKGGGEIVVRVNPVRVLQAVELVERGDILSVTVFSYAAGNLPLKVAEECSSHASKIITNVLPNVKINHVVKKETPADAVGTGSGACIWAKSSGGCVLGGSANGSRNKHSVAVAEEAAQSVVSSLKLGVCADDHLQDQIILFMALAKGKSRMLTGVLTLHTETAIFICEKMLGVKFQIETLQNGTCLVSCEGVGFVNRNESVR